MKQYSIHIQLICTSLVGVFLTLVLSIQASTKFDIPCGGTSNCRDLSQHPSSHLLGVPNAYVGLAGFLILGGLACVALISTDWRRKAYQAGLAFSLIGIAMSGYLQFVSQDLHLFCPWCFAVGLVMLVMGTLFGIAVDRKAVANESESRKVTRSDLTRLALSCTACLVIALAVVFSVASEPPKVRTLSQSLSRLALAEDASHTINPSGQITLVEFGDLNCMSCWQIYPTIKQVVDDSRGKITFIFRHFPLSGAAGHENSLRDAYLAELCMENGHLWEFMDHLSKLHLESLNYKDPGVSTLIAGYVKGPVKDVLSLTGPLPTQASTDKHLEHIRRDVLLGKQLGVKLTPTFILIQPGKPTLLVEGQQILPLLPKINTP